MSQEALKEHRVAEESQKTKKAREKLKKRFEDLDKLITPQALKEKAIEIQRWISRHAEHRIVLREKFSLFDENQNTAKLSMKIAKIADQLRQQGSI